LPALNITIQKLTLINSQGSVATRLRRGGIFSDYFATNSLLCALCVGT